jgi:hypothetical protein
MKKKAFLILSGLFIFFSVGKAQQDIAPAMKAAIYKKILSMDRNIQKKARGRIVFITDKLDVQERELSKSFNELSIQTTVVKSEDFSFIDLKTVLAVYISSNDKSIIEKCVKANILIISDENDLINNGSAAISLTKIDGKVKPLINEMLLNKSGLGDIVAALSKTAIVIH